MLALAKRIRGLGNVATATVSLYDSANGTTTSSGPMSVCDQSDVEPIAAGISPFWGTSLAVIQAMGQGNFTYQYGSDAGGRKVWGIDYPLLNGNVDNACPLAAQI